MIIVDMDGNKVVINEVNGVYEKQPLIVNRDSIPYDIEFF